MHFRFLKHVLAVGLLVVPVEAAPAWGQLESSRKTKNVVTPTYPDLARRMRISGVVRVEVTVAPNGVVKNAKLIGGNPVSPMPRWTRLSRCVMKRVRNKPRKRWNSISTPNNAERGRLRNTNA